MKRLITITTICIMALIPVTIQAQGTGTTALDFLNIGVSAKSSAMGGAFSAIADGPVSSYYNPAGLSAIENYQIAGMHTEWYQDLRYEYLGWGMPVGRNGGLGFSFSYLSYGTIQGYSETGASLGKLEAYDMAFDLSYGHRIYRNLSMGLGIKGVTEKLADISAKGIAGDFGLQLRDDRYLAGISIMNFGPSLKYENSSSPLPTAVNAGVMYKPFGSSVSLMTGASIPFKGEFSFKAGLEYSYNDIFMVRSGYDTHQNYDGKGGISFGAGVNISNHNLDYAYNINDIMGGTHQISFIFKFGKTRDVSQPLQPVQKAEVYKIEPQPPTVYTVPYVESPDGEKLADTDNEKPVEESYTRTREKEKGKNKTVFQVCAARYHDKQSAEKHVETLKKFGINSALFYDEVDKEYRVVVDQTNKKSKALKIKADFDQKGVFCFIEEL